MKLIHMPDITDEVVEDTVDVATLAFSNITFGDSFLFINFECIDCTDHMLFSLTIPVILENEYEEAVTKDLYEDMLAPSGLLMTKDKVPGLMVMDHFRRIGNSNYFGANCVESSPGANPDIKYYYQLNVSFKQFLIIMAILHDVMEGLPLLYQSHMNLYYLNDECDIVDIDATYKFSIEGANVPNNKVSSFGDPNKEFAAQVLCKFEKNDTIERVVMNLAYNRADIRAIQKNNKLPKIDDIIDKEGKDNMSIVIDHTMIEYSIKAANPMGKIVWVAESSNGYKIFTMLNTQYADIVRQINESIT